MKKIIIYLLCSGIFHSFNLYAGEVSVAVASNFKYTLEKLAEDFEVKTGHDLLISSASSGKLFAQIIHGAPYHVFLSADERRADLLVDESRARQENAYVYALGKLVFLSNIKPTHDCIDVLRSSQLKHLAIANPKIAPYGAAAKQVLSKLGLWQQLKPNMVIAENIAQASLFVLTNNAEAGFVARSMLDRSTRQSMDVSDAGCVWDVPIDMYQPIKQKMVVLNRADKNPAAQEFFRYMQSPGAKIIIQATGYDVL
ncbi:MAG: molybdate ABC transporter substrate-binding protein [Proteobacteria bacterium]|nr:molybdate ABC transporter substrate-binding protein [Pseudomonadota bacterium]